MSGKRVVVIEGEDAAPEAVCPSLAVVDARLTPDQGGNATTTAFCEAAARRL